MEEPDVWANVTTHDTVVCNDNDFEVFINPDGTTHNYKEYEMNALATVWNLFLNKPYTDGGWEHSARSMGPRGFDMMTADPPLRSAAKVYGPLNWPLVKNGAENVVDGKAVGCKGSLARRLICPCQLSRQTTVSTGTVEIKEPLRALAYNTTATLPLRPGKDWW